MNLESLKKPKEVKVVNNEEFTVHLKSLRRNIAKYNKIDKLYNVFTNKTLDEILEKKPTTLDELVLIKGIGKKNSDLWGKYLVDEIKKFLQ